MNYQFLSHPLDTNDPGFPGEPTLTIQPSTRIAAGDAYNSSIVHLFNHFGTHFDAPAHFNPHGRSIAELDINHFIYERPLLVDLPKGKASLVEPADLEPLLPRVKNADCLILRTGLEHYASANHKNMPRAAALLALMARNTCLTTRRTSKPSALTSSRLPRRPTPNTA